MGSLTVEAQPGYRPEIDGLRALAIVPVVLFHAGVPGFSGGFIGVDVFFVISGYLITSILVRELAQGGFRFAHFYERRARRIVPALLPVLALSTFAAWAIMTGEDFRHFGRSLGATSVFASNVWYALRSNYFLPEASVRPLLHTWSLGVEEQFYLLFPLLMWVLWRSGRPVRLLALSTLTLASMATAFWLVEVRPQWAFFLLPTRLWELAAGAACALIGRPLSIPGWAGWAGLGMICAGFALAGESTTIPGPMLLLPVAGTMAVVLSHSSSGAVRLLSLRPFVAIGLISYGIYLWHLPLFAFAQYLWLGALPDGIVCLLVPTSVLMGWLSYCWIERPIRHGDVLQSRKSLVLFCIAGLALFTGLGAGAATERLGARTAALERSMDGRFAGEGIDEVTIPPGSQELPFVLYGDSHARQYYRPFARQFGEGALVSGDGCLALPGLSNLDPPDPDTAGCRTKFEDFASLLRERPVGVAIFAALWDRPMWDGATGQGGDLPSAAGRPAFEHALGRAIEQVPTNTRIVIIGHVPAARPRGYPGMQLGWLRCHAYLNATCPDRISRGVAEGEAVNRVLRNFARNHPRVIFLDPADVLCDSKACPIVSDDRLVYTDESHVASWAGSRIAKRVAKLLSADSASETRLP